MKVKILKGKMLIFILCYNVSHVPIVQNITLFKILNSTFDIHLRHLQTIIVV